ncbi:flagellar protein, partial [Sagittula sp. NFXS13]|uniref:flagellin N-terminal helical domain-containing protein n=1 Tax=Sagittula sp. NFXS13 TaxID=2819095 RepID=UPI0032E03231
MSSINTNASAMNALSTLRQVNRDLEGTQSRISTGLQVQSGKDNAAYFQISETMKGDSSVYASINEGLTLTKNSVATARLGAETINGLAQEFLDKVAFAQGATGGQAEIENDLNELVKQMTTTLEQSTFNGDDMLAAGEAAGTAAAVAGATGALTSAGDSGGATPASRNVVTGVTRAGGTYATTSISVDTYDMRKQVANLEAIATGFAANADAATGEAFLAGVLAATEGVTGAVTDIATKLGQSEKSIENQQEFLSSVVDNIDAGVGSMIDANMEEE